MALRVQSHHGKITPRTPGVINEDPANEWKRERWRPHKEDDQREELS